MRVVAWGLVLASCSNTQRRPAIEPAPRVEQVREPAPRVEQVRQSTPTVQLPPLQPTPQPCPPLPNTAAASVLATTANLTRFSYDLCGALDRALGKSRQLAGLGAGGFAIELTLAPLRRSAKGSQADIHCVTTMRVLASTGVIGMVSGSARVQTSSARRDLRIGTEDCIAAVIEDLIVRKVVPSMHHHLAMAPPPAAQPPGAAAPATQPPTAAAPPTPGPTITTPAR